VDLHPNFCHVINHACDFRNGQRACSWSQWANAFWQVMQILIVFFGVTHGLNGLRVVIEDFVGQSIAKPSIRGLIFLLWIFTLIVAIYVVLFS
jgi:succinate dehydrogenase / fumarate reductase membrane anchor subunit